MGTPAFALPTLRALHEAEEYQIVGVFTKPDRPAGRGRKLQMSPVKRYANEADLPLFQPRSLRRAEPQSELLHLVPDLIIVAAYGLILPPAVLDAPRYGALNVHASLLPRHRGASPIAAAIRAGDQESGITIMKMDPGLDTGPIIAQQATPIGPDETAGELASRLAAMGAALLLAVLPKWLGGELVSVPQDDNLATYAPMIKKEEAWLDWTRPALFLARQVRALNPWPVAMTTWQGKQLRIWQARALAQTMAGEVGHIVNWQGMPAVITGTGILLLEEIQLAGKKRLSAAQFCRGYRNFVGGKLISPTSTLET